MHRSLIVRWIFPCWLLATLGFAGISARAQSDAELDTLARQTRELARAGNYAGSIPLAERNGEGIKARHRPESWQYGVALNNPGTQLLFANRYADAGCLFRRDRRQEQQSHGSAGAKNRP
jgi:hypothetical protein